MYQHMLLLIQPAIQEKLPESSSIGEASKIAANIWKALPSDRRKDWREEAQKKIEELDTGVVDIRKNCIKYSCTFIGEKDLK